MKLLDISSFYSENGGGVRTYHREKLDYFAKHPEHEYVLVVSSDENKVEKVPGGTIYRLRGFRVSKNGDYRQISDYAAMKKVLETEKPDVVEIGSIYWDNWLAMAGTLGKGTVKVGFYHADFPDSYLAPAVENFPEGFAKKFVGFWHKYVKFAYSRFDATCVTSQYIEKKLNGYGLYNTVRVPLGVDTNQFHPAKRSEAIRREFDVAPDEQLLLYAGRFSTEKGIETMLDALPGMAADSKRKIVLVGEGPIEARVRAAAADLENVQLHDFIRDKDRLSALYASADLFLSPGPYETFGLSTLEALSSGIPVLVAASGGGKELVLNANGGAAFDAHDPESMIQVANKLLADDLSALGATARAHVENHYSWNHTFDRLVDNYSQLVANKSNRQPRAFDAVS